MFIPAGYANMQLLFRGPNNRNALSAIGILPEGPDLPEPAAAVTQFNSSDFWENMDDSWLFLGVRLTIGTTDPSEPIVLESPTSQAGGNSGTSAPPNCALLLKKFTSRGGRKGRGRMFVPGLPADYITDGGSLGGAVDALTIQLDDVLRAMAGAVNSDELYLFHQEEADGDPDIITSLAVDSTIATQRRRLRG